MNSRIFLVCLAGLLLSWCGCDSGSSKLAVRGHVTLDDKPIPEGDIEFHPDDPALTAEGGKIKEGSYQLKVKPGKYRVRISAVREVPGKKGPMGEPLIESYVPDKYNEKSTLTAEVNSGKKEFDFPLKSR